MRMSMGMSRCVREGCRGWEGVGRQCDSDACDQTLQRPQPIARACWGIQVCGAGNHRRPALQEVVHHGLFMVGWHCPWCTAVNRCPAVPAVHCPARAQDLSGFDHASAAGSVYDERGDEDGRERRRRRRKEEQRRTLPDEIPEVSVAGRAGCGCMHQSCTVYHDL